MIEIFMHDKKRLKSLKQDVLKLYIQKFKNIESTHTIFYKILKWQFLQNYELLQLIMYNIL